MFVISQSQSYFWPVTVQYPVSGGKFEKQTFDGEFKRLAQSQIKDLWKKIEAEEITDADLVRELLVGWKGVQDDHGGELPFSEGARDRLLDVPLVAAAIVESFIKSLSGAKAKN